MKENKKIEEYTKRIIQASGLNSPSSELMANIMLAVSNQPKVVTSYKPLITKNTWVFLLMTAFVFLIGVVVFLYQPSATVINLNAIYDLIIPSHIPNISMSKIMLYCFGFLTLFLIQIPFIKYFIERNFQY